MFLVRENPTFVWLVGIVSGSIQMVPQVSKTIALNSRVGIMLNSQAEREGEIRSDMPLILAINPGTPE